MDTPINNKKQCLKRENDASKGDQMKEICILKNYVYIFKHLFVVLYQIKEMYLRFSILITSRLFLFSMEFYLF